MISYLNLLNIIPSKTNTSLTIGIGVGLDKKLEANLKNISGQIGADFAAQLESALKKSFKGGALTKAFNQIFKEMRESGLPAMQDLADGFEKEFKKLRKEGIFSSGDDEKIQKSFAKMFDPDIIDPLAKELKSVNGLFIEQNAERRKALQVVAAEQEDINRQVKTENDLRQLTLQHIKAIEESQKRINDEIKETIKLDKERFDGIDKAQKQIDDITSARDAAFNKAQAQVKKELGDEKRIQNEKEKGFKQIADANTKAARDLKIATDREIKESEDALNAKASAIKSLESETLASSKKHIARLRRELALEEKVLTVKKLQNDIARKSQSLGARASGRTFEVPEIDVSNIDKARKSITSLRNVQEDLNESIKDYNTSQKHSNKISAEAEKDTDDLRESQERYAKAVSRVIDEQIAAEKAQDKYNDELTKAKVRIQTAGGSLSKFEKILAKVNSGLNDRRGLPQGTKNIEAINIAAKQATNSFGKWAKAGTRLLIAMGVLGSIRRIAQDVTELAGGVARLALEAAKLRDAEVGFRRLAAETTNASLALAKIRKAADGTVDDFTLLQSATTAALAGLDVGQFDKIVTGARALAAVTGRDVPDAIERLTNAITKQERRLLDELGIIVRAEDLFKDYAKTQNIVGRSLIASEKAAAFFDGVLIKVNEKVEKMGGVLDDAQRPFRELDRSVRNARQSLGEWIRELPVFTTLLEELTGLMDLLGDAFEKSQQKGIKALAESEILAQRAEKINDDLLISSNLLRLSDIKRTEGQKELRKALGITDDQLKDSSKTLEGIRDLFEEIGQEDSIVIKDLELFTTLFPNTYRLARVSLEELVEQHFKYTQAVKINERITKDLNDELNTTAKMGETILPPLNIDTSNILPLSLTKFRLDPEEIEVQAKSITKTLSKVDTSGTILEISDATEAVRTNFQTLRKEIGILASRSEGSLDQLLKAQNDFNNAKTVSEKKTFKEVVDNLRNQVGITQKTLDDLLKLQSEFNDAVDKLEEEKSKVRIARLKDELTKELALVKDTEDGKLRLRSTVIEDEIKILNIFLDKFKGNAKEILDVDKQLAQKRVDLEKSVVQEKLKLRKLELDKQKDILEFNISLINATETDNIQSIKNEIRLRGEALANFRGNREERIRFLPDTQKISNKLGQKLVIAETKRETKLQKDAIKRDDDSVKRTAKNVKTRISALEKIFKAVSDANEKLLKKQESDDKLRLQLDADVDKIKEDRIKKDIQFANKRIALDKTVFDLEQKISRKAVDKFERQRISLDGFIESLENLKLEAAGIVSGPEFANLLDTLDRLQDLANKSKEEIGGEETVAKIRKFGKEIQENVGKAIDSFEKLNLLTSKQSDNFRDIAETAMGAGEVTAGAYAGEPKLTLDGAQKVFNGVTSLIKRRKEAEKKAREERIKAQQAADEQLIQLSKSTGQAISDAITDGLEVDFDKLVLQFVKARVAQNIGEIVTKQLAPALGQIEKKLAADPLLKNEEFNRRFEADITKKASELKSIFNRRERDFNRIVGPEILDEIEANQEGQEEDRVDRFRLAASRLLRRQFQQIDLKGAGRDLQREVEGLTPQLRGITSAVGKIFGDITDANSRLNEAIPSVSFAAATEPQFDSHLFMMSQLLNFQAQISTNTGNTSRTNSEIVNILRNRNGALQAPAQGGVNPNLGLQNIDAQNLNNAVTQRHGLEKQGIDGNVLVMQ